MGGTCGGRCPQATSRCFGDVSSFERALGFLMPTMLLLVGQPGDVPEVFLRAIGARRAGIAVRGWIVGTLVLETLLIAVAVIGSSMFHTDSRARLFR